MDVDDEEGDDAEEIGDFCHMFAQPVLGSSSQSQKLTLHQVDCSQAALDTSQTIQHELTRKYITGIGNCVHHIACYNSAFSL